MGGEGDAGRRDEARGNCNREKVKPQTRGATALVFLCLTSLSIMSSKSIHDVANGKICF